MKSREGTVVDADDLMQDMTQTAASISQELGKLEEYSEEKKQELYGIDWTRGTKILHFKSGS